MNISCVSSGEGGLQGWPTSPSWPTTRSARVHVIRSYELQQAAVHKYVVNKESLSSIDISVCSDRMYTLVYFRVESESLLSVELIHIVESEGASTI